MDELNVVNTQPEQAGLDKKPAGEGGGLTKIIIGVIVLVILLGSGAFAFEALKTGAFLSPKKQYLLIEGKNLQKSGGEFYISINKYINENIKPYLDQSYSRNVQLNSEVKLDGTGQIAQKQTKDVLDLIRKLKLTINTQNSYKEQKLYEKTSLMLEGNTLFDLEVFSDQNTIGAAVKALYNKYFVVDRNDVRSAFNKIGIPNAPKKLITNDDIFKALYFNEKEFNQTGLDYGMFFVNSLNEDQIEVKKKVPYQKGNKEVKCREIMVKFSEEQLKSFIKELYGKMAGDEKLLKMTFDNYTAVIKLFIDAGYYDSDPSMKNELMNSIDKLNLAKYKAEFENAIDSMSISDGLKMTLIVDDNGTILDRTVDIKIRDRSYVENNMVFHTWGWDDGKGKTVNFEYGLEEKVENSVKKLSFQVNSYVTGNVKDGTQTGKTGISIVEAQNDKESTAIKINLDNSKNIDKNAGKENNEVKFDSEFKNTYKPAESGKLSGNLSWTVTTDNKDKTNNTSSVLEAKLELPQGLELKKADMVLYTISEDKFGVDVKMPEINDKNSVNLNKISQADFDKLTREIQMSLVGFAMKNMGTLGPVFK